MFKPANIAPLTWLFIALAVACSGIVGRICRAFGIAPFVQNIGELIVVCVLLFAMIRSACTELTAEVNNAATDENDGYDEHVGKNVGAEHSETDESDKAIKDDGGINVENEGEIGKTSVAQSPPARQRPMIPEATDAPMSKRKHCFELSRAYGLTAREAQILMMLADDMSPHDIGASLVIANSTMKSHMSHIYRKLDVHSLSELKELTSGRCHRLF